MPVLKTFIFCKPGLCASSTPGGGGVLPTLALKGPREATPYGGTSFRRQVYERVGISLVEFTKGKRICHFGLYNCPTDAFCGYGKKR